jgi:methionyl-tRNA formyltransferase
MRIVFMGTPDFAVPSLDKLVRNGYDIAAVITSPDSYGGRGGKQLIESAVKRYAVEHNLKILQPERLKNPDFLSELRALNADVQIVVAFRMLPEVVWNMPPLGTFNLHGSLLPKYRGAAPINWAIINGERETGVTAFKLQHEIDTGDIVLQEKIPIYEDDNAGTLHDRMMITGSEVILKTIRMLEAGNITFIRQSDAEATLAPKIYHETCKINFMLSTVQVYNFIRGLSPYPGAWLILDDKECKITSSKKLSAKTENPPGRIITDQRRFLHIATSDGLISIEEIKMEGKRKMGIAEFLNGYRIKSNSVG